MSTNLAVVVPTNIAIPAYLQTGDIAAQVAAANAAAAGGIKIGGFPKVSIEGGKFHEINADETNTYMMAPAAQGQPALPMMCFEAVIIAANPALIKKYYKDKWQKGDDSAPDCQSNNGVTPDVGVPLPQAAVCATCPQNAWGSKISEATQKEVKACSDSKQLVVLPAWFQGWTDYKALGLSVTPAALGNWGKYVKALSGRSIPVSAVVTNITFDATASYPKLQFGFNRYLTADEFALVQERAKGDDVKNIVQPTIVAAPVAALPAPATTVALPPPVNAPAAPAGTATPPVAAAPNFGAAAGSPSIAAAAPAFAGGAVPPVAAEPVKRTRKPRTPPAPAPVTGSVDMSHIPASIQVTIAQVGGPDSPAGKALMAAFPAPVAQPAPVAPVAAAPAPAPAFVAPAAPAAAAPNFAAPVVPAAAPTPQVVSAGASLADILKRKLGISSGPATVQ
jgi:hypothetical protein